MKICLIAAIAKNRAIGCQNQLLYHLPDDMKHFKKLTTGHTVIMGRKTFEALPKGALPNRRNIVLSQSGKTFPGCETFSSIDEALLHCGNEDEVYIIGGDSIYHQTIDLADKLCLTEVEDTPKHADAFFPPFNDWQKESEERHEKDEKHKFGFAFTCYIKKKPRTSGK